MKKTLLTAFAAATLIGFFHTAAHAQMLVINEVYPGGGGGGATTAYNRDFVEIYNSSATPFSLAGYALQYASATGNYTGTIVSFGAGSIIAGKDYLSIYTGGPGTAGATLTAGQGAGFVTYVAPTSSASLSATAGAIRLFNTTTSSVIDVVGFGATTVAGSLGDAKFETAVAAAPTSVAVSIGRTNFVDTNNNSADFTSMTPTPNGGTLATVVIAAPEPSTWAAMVGGMGALALVLRRRRLV